MCQGCWKELGSPKIVNEKTISAQPLIDAVYEHHAAGGSLHIVLDDWNLGDSMVSHCRSITENPPDYMKDDNPSAERKAAELACCSALENMTVEERASALAFYDRMFT